MSVANSMRKGTRGGGDSQHRDVFQGMRQGSMGKHPHEHGLFNWMKQGKSTGHVSLKPGKSAPSVNASMKQGGR